MVEAPAVNNACEVVRRTRKAGEDLAQIAFRIRADHELGFALLLKSLPRAHLHNPMPALFESGHQGIGDAAAVGQNHVSAPTRTNGSVASLRHFFRAWSEREHKCSFSMAFVK